VSSLALLQEEALQDNPGKETRRQEYSSMNKKYSDSKELLKPHTARDAVTKEKKSGDQLKPKSPEDKLFALKNFRRAKGLCFKCGEKWNPSYTYSALSECYGGSVANPL
jgi:hypothetical protein